MKQNLNNLLRLKINGTFYLYRVVSSSNILDLINYLGFNKNVIVIDYNGYILEKIRWDQTFLQNNDSLEILSIAGGG